MYQIMEDIEQIQKAIRNVTFLVPVVSALVEAIKRAAKPQKRFVPLIALSLGIAAGLSIIGLTLTGGVVGAVVGLASVGLYEVGRNRGKKS